MSTANKNCILAEEQAMLEELYLPLMEKCAMMIGASLNIK
jgi:hypothetical protein